MHAYSRGVLSAPSHLSPQRSETPQLVNTLKAHLTFRVDPRLGALSILANCDPKVSGTLCLFDAAILTMSATLTGLENI
jgi:hypothetical protein